ncbi:hypothetical protein AA3250_2063 [Gluconobacter albidus NBRC 3250]|nr:hypothetical protein AA3250_2063 [Gluconobacter albidus NBRC 3250]
MSTKAELIPDLRYSGGTTSPAEHPGMDVALLSFPVVRAIIDDTSIGEDVFPIPSVCGSDLFIADILRIIQRLESVELDCD